MRISTRISGAGSNGLTRLPCLGITSIDEELCTDGALDEGKCRQALNHPDEGIQISGGDCIPVFAFTCELLKQVRDACAQMIENRRDGNNKDAHEEADCADDRHAERNMRRGRFVFVRTDIDFSSAANAVKMRVNIDNPKGVVGVAERIALDYALILARVANHIADQMAEAGCKWAFRFTGGPGCPSLFADARRIDAELKRREETKAANVARWKCERRTASGHCSPCKFDCPHCKGGMCVELEAE